MCFEQALLKVESHSSNTNIVLGSTESFSLFYLLTQCDRVNPMSSLLECLGYVPKNVESPCQPRHSCLILTTQFSATLNVGDVSVGSAKSN